MTQQSTKFAATPAMPNVVSLRVNGQDRTGDAEAAHAAVSTLRNAKARMRAARQPGGPFSDKVAETPGGWKPKSVWEYPPPGESSIPWWSSRSEDAARGPDQRHNSKFNFSVPPKGGLVPRTAPVPVTSSTPNTWDRITNPISTEEQSVPIEPISSAIAPSGPAAGAAKPTADPYAWANNDALGSAYHASWDNVIKPPTQLGPGYAPNPGAASPPRSGQINPTLLGALLGAGGGALYGAINPGKKRRLAAMLTNAGIGGAAGAGLGYAGSKLAEEISLSAKVGYDTLPWRDYSNRRPPTPIERTNAGNPKYKQPFKIEQEPAPGTNFPQKLPVIDIENLFEGEPENYEAYSSQLRDRAQGQIGGVRQQLRDLAAMPEAILREQFRRVQNAAQNSVVRSPRFVPGKTLGLEHLWQSSDGKPFDEKAFQDPFKLPSPRDKLPKSESVAAGKPEPAGQEGSPAAGAGIADAAGLKPALIGALLGAGGGALTGAVTGGRRKRLRNVLAGAGAGAGVGALAGYGLGAKSATAQSHT